MKWTSAIVLSLCLGLAACTSSEERTEPSSPSPEVQGASTREAPAASTGKGEKAAAREPVKPPAAGEAKNGTAPSPLESSKRAVKAAREACMGCPDRSVCETMLKLALRLTNAALLPALQAPEPAEGQLEERYEESATLAEQFDAIGELAKECPEQPGATPAAES